MSLRDDVVYRLAYALAAELAEADNVNAHIEPFATFCR
jgi:hypothetical protein